MRIEDKGEEKGNALARSVVVIYYWGLNLVYLRTTSLIPYHHPLRHTVYINCKPCSINLQQIRPLT